MIFLNYNDRVVLQDDIDSIFLVDVVIISYGQLPIMCPSLYRFVW